MSTLIRDLLDYSRLTPQRDHITPVPLQEVVHQVLTTLELVILEAGASVQVAALPTIRGDATQLHQLFQNLLSNALKFRRSDVAPVIEVRTIELEADQLPAGVKPSHKARAYHLIEVRDNGIGFDETYRERIFEVFQRLHGKTQYAGTGIGLAICQKVVTNHGGAITVSSQPGQGATFQVYLPS
jgi:signal transduction histidine kinase